MVANINGESFGVPHYKTAEEKAVAYFFFVIKNHPFTDGNKRTATLTFRIVCRLNNLQEKLAGYDLDALAIFLEKLKRDDHHEVIKIVAETIFED